MNYVNLITSEHQTKPNFAAVVAALTQWSIDYQSTVAIGSAVDTSVMADVTAPVDTPLVQYTFGATPSLYDLDAAVGVQLDAVGLWVGLTRYVTVPSIGSITLADADFRTLLYAKIAANHWDGSMAGLQAILAKILPNSGIQLFAVDNQDMSMTIYVAGGAPTAMQLALLHGGLLVPRPEGVQIAGISLVTGPLFGLDYETTLIAGLDIGSFSAFI